MFESDTCNPDLIYTKAPRGNSNRLNKPHWLDTDHEGDSLVAHGKANRIDDGCWSKMLFDGPGGF